MVQCTQESRSVRNTLRQHGKWSTVGNSIGGALCLQARIDSSRLPNKALFKIGSHSVIEHAMARLSCIKECVPYLVTDGFSAPFLAAAAHRYHFQVLVESSTHVLKRFVSVILNTSLPFVVRATGDNPLVSAVLAQASIRAFHRYHCDLFIFDGIPKGYGVEVVSSRALVTAHTHATTHDNIEHVTDYIYRNSTAFSIVTEPLPLYLQRTIDFEADVTIDTMDEYRAVLGRFHRTLRNGVAI